MSAEDLLDTRSESALDLCLEGSIGSFSVGASRTGQSSIEVRYFLTHVGLDFSNTSNDALLSHLAPVREIFGFKSLDFDEIMQRDIDDARVSSELIPYLLDENSADLIKLFPPIVVVVLPLEEDEKRPAKLYPKVFEQESIDELGKGTYFLRSGFSGQETFQFEQPVRNHKKLNHDLARLRLNTYKTCLVIVDGQHRAMALLALYRNLKDQWSDENRIAFKDYYSEWTKSYIQRFNLKQIQLPVILCTFPGLNHEYTGDFDLRKASRLVFLTLNKNARKVSDSRNKLLDDNDLIASFLRKVLSSIKNKDNRSQHSLRIFNVELDQFEDKLKIQSPIAITGVNHVYYMVEHLMLNEGGEVDGIKPRTGKFYKRTNLTDYGCLKRLNGRNLLGSDVADMTSRTAYTVDSEMSLGNAFLREYGKTIIDAFEQFLPYEIHNKAVLDLEQNIQANQDRRLYPILFEGQGIGRVFESHRINLKQKIQEDYFSGRVPELSSISQLLDGTARRIEEAIYNLNVDRAQKYISNIPEKGQFKDDEGRWSQGFVGWINRLYADVFSTVAFQSALIAGFWIEVERANREINKVGGTPLSIEDIFSDYIAQINSFFIPKTISNFRRLVRVLSGDLAGSIADWRIISSNHTFRRVVYRGEMQPDQWPKYKYLLLEIWHPENSYFNAILSQEREYCRKQVMASLYKEQKSTYCQDNLKREEMLEENELKRIFDSAYKAYSSLIENIGLEKLERDSMESVILAPPKADEGNDLSDLLSELESDDQ
jgi:DNA-sulfur modification-associated